MKDEIVWDPKKPKAKPCRKCGGTDFDIWDQGYSSFNVGGIRCKNKKCGHEIKVYPCGCFPRDEIVHAWNTDKPDIVEVMEAQVKELRKKLRAETRKTKKATKR